MSRTAKDGVAESRPRKRRPKAEAELAAILAADRPLARRCLTAATVLRLAPVTLPIWLRFALDPIREQRSIDWFGWQWSPAALLVATVLVGLLVAVVRSVSAFVFVSTAGWYGHRMVGRMRIAMYEHILRIPARYLDRRGPGRVLLRFIGDSDALRNWVSRTRPTLIADAVLLATLVLALMVVATLLGVAVALSLPAVVSVIWRLRPALYQRTLEARRRQAELTGHIESRLRRLRQAKWLDRYRAFRQPTRELAMEIAHHNARRDLQAARVEAVGQLMAFGLLPLVLAGGVTLLWHGRITVGQFVAATWLLTHIMVVLHRMSRSIIIREKAMVSIDRILRLLERAAERGRGSEAPALKVRRPVLECRDLVLSDAGPGSAAQPWNARLVGPGIVVLPATLPIGAFRDRLLGFRKPTDGALWLDGRQLDATHVRSRRRAVGWITSELFLCEGSVEDNLRLGAPKLSQEKLRQRLSESLGEEVTDAWLQQNVSANGHNIDADQGIRIAYARALLNRPRVLLVEDLGEVSLQTKEWLAGRLRRQSRRMLVLVAHRVARELERWLGDLPSPAAANSNAALPPLRSAGRSAL